MASAGVPVPVPPGSGRRVVIVPGRGRFLRDAKTIIDELATNGVQLSAGGTFRDPNVPIGRLLGSTSSQWLRVAILSRFPVTAEGSSPVIQLTHRLDIALRDDAGLMGAQG